MVVLAVVNVVVAFPVNDTFEVVTAVVISDCFPESRLDESRFDEDDSSMTGEFRGIVDVGDVYLLDGGVKCVTFGAEIPFTAKIGFDS